ncbi:MAG: flagellar biosynthetic protein FliR [Bdellovibrionota bacterium]|nr:MAG: flagellar biosynthetic protein FliR [Bdellovibrionota bacterium]
MEHLAVPLKILENLPAVWTFLLIFVRYAAFMIVVPGIGSGMRGAIVRIPAVFAFSIASMAQSPIAPLPDGLGPMLAGVIAEVLLGAVIGFLPLLIVSGAQTAAHLASTSMGLGANQLLDPTSGSTVNDLSRIIGDIAILVFLGTGGDHVVLMAVSGLGGTIMPGTFLIGEPSMNLLVERSAHVFRAATMLSAPVIVALLLTQFVMGLISRAVPTVNIFIVSFPLTIGIGLILTALALPDTVVYLTHDINRLEDSILVVTQDATTVPIQTP